MSSKYSYGKWINEFNSDDEETRFWNEREISMHKVGGLKLNSDKVLWKQLAIKKPQMFAPTMGGVKKPHMFRCHDGFLPRVCTW